MKYISKIPASCGELIQGFMNGYEFLINAPIPMFAETEVILTTEQFHSNSLYSNNYSKVAQSIEMLCEIAKIEKFNCHVKLNSAIPRNKGLSSSTAEISAALFAISSAVGRFMSYEEISKIILAVDGSSDAVFLDGITHINQLNGNICKQYSNIPNLSFIIVDAGGEIETQKFDRQFARWIAQKNQFSLKRALNLIQTGFETQNPKLIAQAATISAQINQYIHYKSPLYTLLEGTQEFGGLGVNCAHTGTVLGVMFDHTQTDAEKLKARIEKLIHPLPILGTYPLISGMAHVTAINDQGDVQHNAINMNQNVVEASCQYAYC